MPGSIDDYFRNLLDVIAACTVVRTSELNFDKRSSMVGFVKGAVFFTDESTLHIRELIDVRKTSVRVMYVYHYQDKMGELIFRYDNTPHHAELASFPHHKHTANHVDSIDGELPEWSELLSEIEVYVI